MIPDSFYKITSDAKTNSLAGISKDEKRLRGENIADRKKDFSRILSNREKKDGQEEQDEKLIKGEESSEMAEDALAQKKENMRARKSPAPFVDPLTNQTETLAKDSKVAPRLGKEKPIAPAEQPWSEPYIEKNEKTPPIAPVAKNEKEGLLNDLPSDSPAMLFSRMAKEGTHLLHMPLIKSKLADFIPKRGELEITVSEEDEKRYLDKDEGFYLIPVKFQDQDIALINLAVIALQPSDMLVEASKLKPAMVKIPPFIAEVAAKIDNELKSSETTTTITLKNVGIFDGVTVTVTAFKTARSEINVQFSNMTQEAKNVLEMNLDALKQALDNKGHTVHMITASTIKEEPIASTGPTPKEKDETGEQRQNREKKEQEEEEA